MSWGIKITVLYLGFVAIILTLVLTCLGHKTELEFRDYYAKELKFQDQIDAVANASLLSTPINYEMDGRAVRIIFPKQLMKETVDGTVYFLRPSDASKDRTVRLAPGADGTQMIAAGFIRGVYKMQISFTSLGKSYYKEAIINFN